MKFFYASDDSSLNVTCHSSNDVDLKSRRKRGALRILVVTLAYPHNDSPNSGVWGTFVKEQVDSLHKYCPELTIDVCLIPSYKSLLEYFRALLLLPGIIHRNGYDVVHAHFGLSLLSLIFASVPVIVTFHGSDLLASPVKYLSKLLARKATKCIVVAKKLRNELGYGEVIPCGIDIKQFSMPTSHFGCSSPRQSGCLRILFPSRPLNKVKDYSLFQAVCQELERRGNLVEQVHLTNIKRADIPEVFWNCDIMILTSHYEGSPTVIKEAIAAKLPFVSVDVGDVAEWAGLVEFGEVVADRDPKTITNAVITLLNRTKNRQLLDNSNCLVAMDIANIAIRVRREYDKMLKNNDQ